MGGHTQARVVVDEVRDLDDHALCDLDVGDVALPGLVGKLGQKRFHELFGRLCGWGVTKPRARSTRQMVGTDGTLRPGLDMWKWMVAAPASKPPSSKLFAPGHDLVLVEIGDPRR